MTTKPYYNAGLGSLYIILIVTLVNNLPRLVDTMIDEKYLMYLAPIGMLSLFVLSATVMGYLFLYQPITMYLEGKRAEALKLFWQTLAIFAIITAVVLGTALIVVTK